MEALVSKLRLDLPVDISNSHGNILWRYETPNVRIQRAAKPIHCNAGLGLAEEPSDLGIDDLRMSDWAHMAKTSEFDYSDAW